MHPILTEVTLEQPINIISPSIFIAYHDLPRGLVVRIRRSHRRGSGSIPGVGIASLFGKSNIRDLQVGLRVRDRVRIRFSNFKPVTFPEPLFFMLVFGRESSSWDEMGMCCDNVKPEN